MMQHSRHAAPPRVGQSWPIVPDHLRSHATGLPRAVMVELGETPPRRPDPTLADPLEPASTRGLIPVVDPPAAPPAPAGLAARALRMLGRLVAAAALALVCSFVGWE